VEGYFVKKESYDELGIWCNIIMY